MSAIRPAIRAAIRPAIRSVFGGSEAAVWSPTSLFAANEVGVLYEPSDLTTMWQDSAGTTPVTADGQTVGLILDKSKGLTIGADLATNGAFAADASWTKGTGWSIGSGVATKTAGSAGALTQTITSTATRWYKITATITRTAGTLTVSLGTSRSTAAFTASYTGSFYVLAGSGTQTLSFSGDASFAGTVDNVVVTHIAGNHAYQATASYRPLYKTSGGLHWLQFDGTDDLLQTAEIDFSATKGVTFIGIGGVNASSVPVWLTVNPSDYYWAAAQSGSSVAPHSMVSDPMDYRVNGVLLSLETRTAMYTATSGLCVVTSDGHILADSPIKIGGYTAFMLSGRLYGVILRGVACNAAQIAQAEAYMAEKSGVTL